MDEIKELERRIEKLENIVAVLLKELNDKPRNINPQTNRGF